MENRIRVLIADEDKEFRRVLSETLSTGNQIEIAGSFGDGKGLVQKILDAAPDVLLIDLMLPGVDGLTVLHGLNDAAPARMPVIFVLSSFASQETTAECNALGVSFYLRKLEQKGRVLVIRPEAPLNIARVEHDPKELTRVYQLGRSVAEKRLEEMQAFLAAK